MCTVQVKRGQLGVCLGLGLDVEGLKVVVLGIVINESVCTHERMEGFIYSQEIQN